MALVHNMIGVHLLGKALDDPTLYSIRRERRTELMAEGLRWMGFDSSGVLLIS